MKIFDGKTGETWDESNPPPWHIVDGPGHYTPERDPNGTSRILVAFVHRGDLTIADTGHLDVLTSMGVGYEMALLSGYDIAGTFIEDIHQQWARDGVYVVEARWSGSHEDTSYRPKLVRLLDAEERSWIGENGSFHGARVYWARHCGWGPIPCRVCHKLPEDHRGLDLECPKKEGE